MTELLRRVESLYEVALRPDLQTWYFDAGVTGVVHQELAAAGLIVKVLGTEKGYAWRLTDAGLAQLKSRV